LPIHPNASAYSTSVLVATAISNFHFGTVAGSTKEVWYFTHNRLQEILSNVS